ncbi:MAG TPA: FG-GAP-like repeat-containing protein, partial [Planctomycetota bacterium]|nr:FG-GAP-like repeat-containing protein [Planctomycetota bacterium]
RLFLNGGSGIFTDATSPNLPGILEATNAVALGDVDGDGDLDAFLGTAGQERLLLNDGSGVFTDASLPFPLDYDLTRAVALGDVDGDGDLDALIGNATDGLIFLPPQPDRLYLNDGSGVFVDATSQLPPSPLSRTFAISLGDVDEDGDLDALIGIGYPGGPDRLFLNDGAGVFSDATIDLQATPGQTFAALLGDLDGDGDLDAFLGNRGEDYVLSNLTRQLAWRGIPRIGKPLTLDLHGPSFGAWFLGFSFGTADVPIPPLGTLRLDPASLFFALGGLFDGTGRATVGYAVPANPALLGATVYWQALVAGPARFANLEITSLTSL